MPIVIPEKLIAALRNAKRVVVLTGAGVSAESNIPTFRDAMSGLWSRYRPEDLATPEAFLRNPKLVWEWYQWRREVVGGAVPNPGHHALAEMERRIDDFLLVTQNVDGLHQKAGSRKLALLHGNLHATRCFDNGHEVTTWKDDHVPPVCPQCDSLLRPDVVWFGESLPQETLSRAVTASAACDLFMSVGTSALVQPAASLVYQAMTAGATTVEINPQATQQASSLDYALQGPSGEILPQLLGAAWPEN